MKKNSKNNYLTILFSTIFRITSFIIKYKPICRCGDPGSLPARSSASDSEVSLRITYRHIVGTGPNFKRPNCSCVSSCKTLELETDCCNFRTFFNSSAASHLFLSMQLNGSRSSRSRRCLCQSWRTIGTCK